MMELVVGTTRWNHNIHYHELIVGALPQGCGRVLDVGCGEGVLAARLSEVAYHVVGVDRDPATLDIARRDAAADNVDYVLGDVLDHPFQPESFDAVVSVATLHHLGTTLGLTRMGELLRPGGTLAVVGLARSRSLADIPFDVGGMIATRVHRRTRGDWETTAPKVWPPAETYRQTRRAATAVLPSARWGRHLLWRYSLVWTKP